ncbi:hypothetical protein NBRC10513_000323 [Rhodotorula toruloides]|uniref:PQ loop repeat-domain containing protein n=1 Tax=Rhodotorula toruloides TaxID=5286 RepID=A0A2T0A9C4_RHOTO|nr:PQ loop repeat-domain containing protein [Rhodotorula toruloides]
MLSFWTALSHLLGWTYTAAWSVSFYPQLILNWRRKSVTGLSIDFLTLNPLGFLCYSISNLALYASSTVRASYRARHDGHNPQVALNDVVFAVHACAVAGLTWGQSWVYQRDPSQRLSSYNRLILLLLFLSLLTLTLLATLERLSYLSLVLFLSSVKLYVSAAKMVPQAWVNYRRKSTEGWSIENILLDATGGLLSLTQLVLDSWVDGDWTGITGNPGKLGLSLLALAFDALFVVQHFVLYRGRRGSSNGKEQEREDAEAAAGARARAGRGEQRGGSLGDRGALLAGEEEAADEDEEEEASVRRRGTEREPLLGRTRRGHERASSVSS